MDGRLELYEIIDNVLLVMCGLDHSLQHRYLTDVTILNDTVV